MDVAPSASNDALGSVADQIFDLLWVEGGDPIPTAGDHACQEIWLQLITGARRRGARRRGDGPHAWSQPPPRAAPPTARVITAWTLSPTVALQLPDVATEHHPDD